MTNRACSLGIDIGGTSTKLALVTDEGVILKRTSLPSAARRMPKEVFDEIAAASRAMAAAGHIIRACGIGIPGVVDHASGFLVFSGPLEWRNVAVAQIAPSALDCAVAVDTDVNAGALADLYYGCARDSSDLLYVSWGTGIGAGFAVSRRLYHTRGGAMCNLGHVPVDMTSSRRCYCGCTGCLEIEAGGKALVDQAREAIAARAQSILSDEITPERIASAAAAGDALARSLLERAAMLMARALSGALALLNPDTVVFGGGVSQCLPLVRGAFDAELRARTPVFSIGLTAIRESVFGADAGVIGAAALGTQAAQEIYERRT